VLQRGCSEELSEQREEEGEEDGGWKRKTTWLFDPPRCSLIAFATVTSGSQSQHLQCAFSCKPTNLPSRLAYLISAIKIRLKEARARRLQVGDSTRQLDSLCR